MSFRLRFRIFAANADHVAQDLHRGASWRIFIVVDVWAYEKCSQKFNVSTLILIKETGSLNCLVQKHVMYQMIYELLAQSRYEYVNVRNIEKYAANNLMYFMLLYLGLHSGTIIFMPLDAKHNVVSIGYVNLCFGSFKYYAIVMQPHLSRSI